MTDEVLEWCRRLWHLVFLLWAAGVILCAVMLGGCDLGDGKSRAQENAEEWARDCGMVEVDRIICDRFDTDDDGYVSCAFVIHGQVRTFECAGSFSLNQGCREPKAAVHVHRE